VTKLSVQRVAAMMMGVWFLSSAFAAYAAGLIAGLMAIDDQNTGSSGQASLVIYTLVFEKLGYFAIAVAAGLLVISPWIRRRMHVSMRA